MSVNLVDNFDINLLDNVVKTFFNSTNVNERSEANKVLMHFQQNPDSWKRVDSILDQSNFMQTKFIALQILESLIKTMWKVLPIEQRQGIRTFVVAQIIKVSSDDAAMEKNKTYLSKLNLVLVQILKQDWPANWPQFIPEIVQSSKSNLALCENNMVILKLLSEEIFDFSAEQMTQEKTKNLKNQMCGEFSEIFQLCFEILEKAAKPSLIKTTLETLLKFLNWIPLGYIFETNLITILIERFLGNELALFRNPTLKCLTEIGSLRVGAEYNERFVKLFIMVMEVIQKLIPVDQDLMSIYDNANDEDQEFIQNLALFLTTFLWSHLKAVEGMVPSIPAAGQCLNIAHIYLIRISQIKERELFKICIEYWAKMVQSLFEEIQAVPPADPLLNHNQANRITHQQLHRKHNYVAILSRLRVVMIERMVKPEEVLIVENDEGEIVREFIKESDTIVVYKSMKEILVYLTHLDTEDTERIMIDKLTLQMDEKEFTWERLNTLCWAIGSISGAMNEEVEKRFLVSVIKDLLGLCEVRRGKDNKAVVASNIMYVVGQYPRFLKAHWKFLKTVVNKLFEFMHESHEGVQDMACDTFIKIAQKCRRHFVMQQPNEVMPYIEEILQNIQTITNDLTPSQVHTFYEAVGHMISAQPTKIVQDRLIQKCMEIPNGFWDSQMQQARVNANVLEDSVNIKILGNIMKTNVSACSSIGSPFFIQIQRIYLDLLSLYKAVSGLISSSVASQGEVATKTPRVRGMRTIKKEILKLVEIYIQKAEDLPTVNANLIPPLLEAILLDYRQNVEDARDAEVLSVMATIFTRLEGLMSDKVAGVFDAVFECTLQMISRNFEDFPEHRVAFYKMLHALNGHCFNALLSLPPQPFKLYMDSIIWGIKHSMRDISDMGLQICSDMFDNFSKMPPVVSFKLQSQILMKMFKTVEDNLIEAKLYNPTQVTNPNLSNRDYLKEYVCGLLQNAFPHLTPNQILQFVTGLFELSKDYNAFKNHLRDFLISLKEFAGNDLMLDEREAEAKKLKEEQLKQALLIPGMVKPSER
ncbi:Karyopherin transporter [Clydaea vesicula]|uniref:Karyopherin transporter n=1 Tax=Clydaea vesicula TaxID=447962 RepID=A0AAD5TZW6_9FUNG|nr:Karyopherin transporter [Clydaea vesicula]